MLMEQLWYPKHFEVVFQDNFGRPFSQVAEVADRIHIVARWDLVLQDIQGDSAYDSDDQAGSFFMVTMLRTPKVKWGGNHVSHGVSWF